MTLNKIRIDKALKSLTLLFPATTTNHNIEPLRFHPLRTEPHEMNPRVHDEAPVVPSHVLRKIDRRLIPLLFTTYMLSFMDKTILSSASVFGLIEDTVPNSKPLVRSTASDNISTWSDSSTVGCPVYSTLDILSGNGYGCQYHSFPSSS